MAFAVDFGVCDIPSVNWGKGNDMNLIYNGKRIVPNWAFAFYFIMMCCCYTYTYVQLFVQLFILAYVAAPVLLKGKLVLSRQVLKNLCFYLLWFGGFTLLLYLSKFWAYSVYAGSKTMLTVFRIFAIGCAIFYYTDSKKKALSLLQSFILGCFIMGLAALLTTSSAIGTEAFGRSIGQHRNQIGAVSAALAVICYFLKKNYEMRYGRALSIYFIVLTMLTGSRSSILQIGLIIAVYILFTGTSVSKKIKNIIAGCLVGVIFVILLQNIPFLREIVWVRIENAIKTVLGIEIADQSALGRSYYKTIAYMMFLERPLLGYGLDGFTCFVRDNPYIMSTAYLNSVYSHCNYAELAANLGVVGLLVWYIPILLLVKRAITFRNQSLWGGCLFSIFASMVILDYSRIPWETHLAMYLLFIVILLITYESKETDKGDVNQKGLDV